MRKFNVLYLSFICIMLAVSVSAETIPFRSGNVLSADLSLSPKTVANFNLNTISFSKKYYAQIICTVSPNRILSRLDYSINAFGVTYPCIAIARGNGAFNTQNIEYSNIKPNEKFAMIFILDGNLVGIDNIENLHLKCNAPGNYPATPIPFTNLRNKALPTVNSTPLEGKFPSK